MGVMWVEVAKCAYDEQVESYLRTPHKKYVRLFPPATFYYIPDSILVPALQSLPAPGGDDLLPLSFADLVYLTHFSLTPGTNGLTIDASATLVNPKPGVFSQCGKGHFSLPSMQHTS